MNTYMGVDIGTSGAKAVVFDDNGRQLCRAYREYDVESPRADWAEINPDLVTDSCFAVIKEAAEGAERDSVIGLGISSQGEAFSVLDREGNAIYKALPSFDGRAVDYAHTFPKDFGLEKLYRITGHTPHPMFSLFKLLWLRDNEKSVWDRAWKFLCFEDLLEYRLGIENPAIGWPLAGRTMLFDVSKHTWHPDILEAVGIKNDQLARPLQSGTLAGRLSDDMTARLGLKKGCFVVTGGHDQPCSALGGGAVSTGIGVYSTGTVECITPAFEKPVFSQELRKHNLCTYDHTAPDLYATVAFNLTGGNILKWFRDQFGKQEILEAEKSGADPYDLLLHAAGDEPSKLLVLPYFTPTGTPYFDTDTPGAVIGLRLTTKRGEFIRGLLEGVALEMRLNLEILEQSGYTVNQLRVIGGGAKSDIWNQLKADVTGKPITVLDRSEAGCFGVAMLAKAAAEERNVKEIIAESLKPKAEIEPDDEKRRVYDKKFEKYKELYPAVKGLAFSG